MAEQPKKPRQPADAADTAQRPGDLSGVGPWTRAEIERALGGALMSPEQLLTTRQAAVLLGCTMNHVRYLRRTGRLWPTGERHRRWRLADLATALDQPPPPRKRHTEPLHNGRLPTDEAAIQLGVPRRTLRRWITDGKLPAARDSRGQWWVRPDDLESVNWRDHDPVHHGRVPSAEAARILQIPTSAFREAAAAGKVPAVKDTAGRWWARPDQLETIRRARRSEELGELA